MNHQYIFDSWKVDFHIGLLMCGIGIFATIIFTYLPITCPRFYKDKRGNLQDKYAIGRMVLIVGLLISITPFYYYWRRIQIEDNCGTVIGIFTKITDHGHAGLRYEYTYTVGNKRYYGDAIFGRREALKKIAPCNCYEVLYDTTNPSHSVMNIDTLKQCPPDNMPQ